MRVITTTGRYLRSHDRLGPPPCPEATTKWDLARRAYESGHSARGDAYRREAEQQCKDTGGTAKEQRL